MQKVWGWFSGDEEWGSALVLPMHDLSVVSQVRAFVFLLPLGEASGPQHHIGRDHFIWHFYKHGKKKYKMKPEHPYNWWGSLIHLSSFLMFLLNLKFIITSHSCLWAIKSITSCHHKKEKHVSEKWNQWQRGTCLCVLSCRFRNMFLIIKSSSYFFYVQVLKH